MNCKGEIEWFFNEYQIMPHDRFWLTDTQLLSRLLLASQGDQNRRIFASRAIVYFEQGFLFKKCATFSMAKFIYKIWQNWLGLQFMQAIFLTNSSCHTAASITKMGNCFTNEPFYSNPEKIV
jgi:hypothetical protein